MKILTLDMGKSKSVACIYQAETGEHMYRTVVTTPVVIHDLIVGVSPDRIVIEIGPSAGWLADMVRAMEIELQVVNVAHQAWRWRNVKAKSDRLDALKLAELSVVNQLSLVHVPERAVRQWRSLISYRKQMVMRRTQIQNTIRAILVREGRSMPDKRKGWSSQSLADLEQLARPLEEVEPQQLWRGQLWLELRGLEATNGWLKQLETKLDRLAAADSRCGQLMMIPGVGPRLSEAVVATLDNPHRIKNARHVGAYVGLRPRRY